MEKKVSKEEQELADKIEPLVKEEVELYFKRANGVTLEKNQYIGERTSEIDKEVGKLKTEKKKLKGLQNPDECDATEVK